MASGASMIQLRNVKTMTQVLRVMVDASALSAADSNQLTALIQSENSASSDSDDSDEELGAPAAAVISNKSGGIVEILHGLIEKAETQLEAARKAETKSLRE